MTRDRRLRRILVVCPERGGKALLERASLLARRHEARLDLVYALPVEGGEPPLLRNLALRAVRPRLEERVDRLREEGIPASGRVLRGKPFVEIIREVLRAGHDLVLVPPVVRGGLRETLFGSTTLHLLRKCPVPVWVVREPRLRRLTRVLAAVSLGDDDSKQPLDVDILRISGTVARAEGGELHVVHCWSLPFEGMLWRAGYGHQLPEIRKLRRETREEQGRRLEHLVRSAALDDVAAHVHLVQGEADVRIPQVARSHRADLVVMGTIARAGLAGVFIGNTAERVLQRLTCSVLAVKPEGFVTPVR